MRARAALAAMVLGLAALGTGGAPAAGEPAQATTESFTLDNGLRVTLQPFRSRSPDGATGPWKGAVSVLVLYEIGGDMDPPGKSGLAHLVEHLAWTCAAGDRRARTADEAMTAHPLGWNAQTGDRFTVLASVVEPGAVDSEIVDAAARMGALAPAEEDLAREKPRVAEELRNMYSGTPWLAARNLARERLRPAPNGGRHGGLEEAIRSMSLAEVRERWTRFYKPRNARLVIAGDFDPSAVVETLRRRFGPIPSGEPSPPAGAILSPPARDELDAVRVVHVPRDEHRWTAACVAVDATTAPGSREWVALMILATRIPRPPVPLREFARVRANMPHFSPLDDDACLYVGRAASDLPADASAVEPVRAALAQAATGPVTDADRAGALNGIDAATGRITDAGMAWMGPYGVAFALARWAQLALAPREVIDSVARVDSSDLAAAAKRRAAAVVVVPDLPPPVPAPPPAAVPEPAMR